MSELPIEISDYVKAVVYQLEAVRAQIHASSLPVGNRGSMQEHASDWHDKAMKLIGRHAAHEPTS